MAYTLQRDAAVSEDQSLLAAGIARAGTDIDAFANSVTEDGSVAQFERALEEAAFEEETPMIDDIPEEELEEVIQASVTSMADWVRSVNASMRNG